MNHEGILKPALIGGVLLGILSVIPVIQVGNCFCCAWVIAGGILASYLYVKSSPVAVTLGRGVALGLLAGAIGAIVDTLFSIPIQVLLSKMGMGAGAQIRQMMEQIPQLPPELRKALLSVIEGERGIGIALILMGGLFKLALYSFVAMLGGTIGVAIFEKRDRPGRAPAEPPVYQPPPDLPPPPSDTTGGQPPTL
jgi:hypothetical protein